MASVDNDVLFAAYRLHVLGDFFFLFFPKVPYFSVTAKRANNYCT